MKGFSDFIVYADESGSPTLENPDPEYPVFVLAFIVVEKSVYCQEIVPSLQASKFNFFGHDQIVLHERDIRRQSGSFALLRTSEALREAFLERITEFVRRADVTTIASAIRKNDLSDLTVRQTDAYFLSMLQCMGHLRQLLLMRRQEARQTYVVFESRGAKEDRELELSFRRLAALSGESASTEPILSPVFADKKSNSSGLQMADLFARPIGRYALHPDRPNRPCEALRSTLHGGRFACVP